MTETPGTMALEAAWQSVAELFPLVQAEATGIESMTRLRDSLVALFTELGVPDVATRFVLPADYARYLELSGGTRRQGGEYGMYLFGPDSVYLNTDHDCRLFADNRPDDASMWITIGHWSDKHDVVLCCDTADVRFGSVGDGHDDHPWLGGGAVFREADTFTEYLALGPQ